MHGSDMDTESGLLSVTVKTAQRWTEKAAEKRGANRARENSGKTWDRALVWLDAGFLFKPRQLLRQTANFPPSETRARDRNCGRTSPRRAVHSGPPRGHFKVDQAGWVILGRDWLGQGRSLPIGPA